MQKSRILSDLKIRKIFKELNEYFYKKKKLNIAVENAISSDEFISFSDLIKSSIESQIKNFVNVKNVSVVVNSFKKIDDEDLEAITIESLEEYVSKDGFFKYLSWAAILGGVVALERIGANNLDFILSEKSKDVLNSRIEFAMKSIDNTTKTWIFRMLKNGYLKGMTAEEIIEFVEINIADHVARRADTIAETELVNMFSNFTHLTQINNGGTKHRWITAGDEQTCEICSSNENQGWIDINKEFGSGVLYPPAHIRCRCFIESDAKISGRVWRG